MKTVSVLFSLSLWMLQITTCRGFVIHPAASPRRITITARHATQLLEFTEPTTGVQVKLVGAMHYNPASIQLAADTIDQLAAENKLGSVLIESCDIRWNSTNRLPDAVAALLNSEMRTAHDLALEYGRPVVLGDQLINATVSQMGRGLRETVVDLAVPWTGWKAIASNLTQARAEAVPLGSDYLGLFDFLDPKLLLAAPISFLKYPLSYFVKSPMSTAVLFGLLFWADSSSAATTAAAVNEPVALTDLFLSLAGSALEIILFARIFLKELLMERNQVIARNILEQCRYYQVQPRWKQWLNQWSRSTTSSISYAEGSVRPEYESEKTVVAVLGMAHCNGIRKLLEEQRV